MIVMTGHPRLALVNSVATLILNATLNLILIPTWGVVGAAVATGASITIVSIVRLLQVYRLLKLWPYDSTFFKPCIASVVALSVALVMNHLVPAELSLFHLIVNLVALWSIYAVTTMLLGFSDEDRIVLSRTKRRFAALLIRR